ncbi:hypothetical protein ADUPG1_006138 [Aduncisulcus paluster]|uniref:Uncharacterized protein n=1 Tax=Aduncisulcus paluster TaxID=2918883 RepID=A0ABQ5KGY1_9EUKA|nr:hypothetical protein ADUPG1_006138 [Aduncisulcus paluster]
MRSEWARGYVLCEMLRLEEERKRFEEQMTLSTKKHGEGEEGEGGEGEDKVEDKTPRVIKTESRVKEEEEGVRVHIKSETRMNHQTLSKEEEEEEKVESQEKRKEMNGQSPCLFSSFLSSYSLPRPPLPSFDLLYRPIPFFSCARTYLFVFVFTRTLEQHIALSASIESKLRYLVNELQAFSINTQKLSASSTSGRISIRGSSEFTMTPLPIDWIRIRCGGIKIGPKESDMVLLESIQGQNDVLQKEEESINVTAGDSTIVDDHTEQLNEIKRQHSLLQACGSLCRVDVRSTSWVGDEAGMGGKDVESGEIERDSPSELKVNKDEEDNGEVKDHIEGKELPSSTGSSSSSTTTNPISFCTIFSLAVNSLPDYSLYSNISLSMGPPCERWHNNTLSKMEERDGTMHGEDIVLVERALARKDVPEWLIEEAEGKKKETSDGSTQGDGDIGTSGLISSEEITGKRRFGEQSLKINRRE